MTVMALHGRLQAIAPDRASLQTRLLAALDRLAVGDLRLHVFPASLPATVIGFETSAGPVELAPLIVDNAVPMLLADDGMPDAGGAIAALAGLETLVSAIEVRLGIALRPVSVGMPSTALWLRVDAIAPDGAIRHAIALGMNADTVIDPAPLLPSMPGFGHGLSVAWAFAAAGPRLAPARLAVLAPGDVVLVGGQSLRGVLRYAGRHLDADFSPHQAMLTIIAATCASQGVPIVSDETHSTVDTPAHDGAIDHGLRLPITVEIAGGTATLGVLAGLSAGSILPLGFPGAGVPVTLVVGGTPIAAGELVAVGEAYGVMISQRLDTAG